MTKAEREQFGICWIEAENIITMMDPYFQPSGYFKRPGESGPEELKLLLQVLRTRVKLVLHDKETTARERDTFYRMLAEQGATDG